MERTRNKVILLSLLVLLSLLNVDCSKYRLKNDGRVNNAYWPQFLKNAARNGSDTVSCSFPLNLLWEKRVSTAISPAMISINDIIIYGTLDGAIEGKYLQKGESIGKIATSSKIPTTCAYTESYLIAIRRSGKNNVICYDLKSAKSRWTRTIGMTLSEPLMFEEHIYVATLDGYLYRLRLYDGEISKKSKIDAQIWSSPSFMDGVLLIGDTHGDLHAFDADFGELWHFSTGASIRATATINDGRVFIGSTNGYFYCLDLMTGKLLWRKKTDGAIFTSAVARDSSVIFGATDHNVYCCNSASGSEQWRFETGSGINTAPVLSKEHVFIGSMDNNFYALDFRTGAKSWSYATKGRIRSNPIISQRYLLISAENDLVYCFAL